LAVITCALHACCHLHSTTGITLVHTSTLFLNMSETSYTPLKQPQPDSENEWMKENGTSPPNLPSSTQYSKLADARESMEKDKEEWTKHYSNEGRNPQAIENERCMLEYLYGRQFDGDESPEVRVKRMAEFVADMQTKLRFHHVLNLRYDTTKHGSEKHMNFWLHNQILLLLYGKQCGANTIFMDREIPLVYRIQRSRNCYLHSVATLLGYKLAWSNAHNSYSAVSVDVGKYVRSYFDNEMLYNRIVKNEGGSTKRCVVAMAGKKNVESLDIDLCRDSSAAYLASQLAELGPAVISNFQVDELFHVKLVQPEKGNYILPQFDMEDGPATELSTVGTVPTTADASYKKDALNQLVLGVPTEEDINLAHNIKAKYTSTATAGDVNKITSTFSEDDSPSLVAASTFSTCPDDEAATLYPDKSDNDGADVEDLGNHSMVIIGYRKEVQGTHEKYWFLIQNSWENMCLAEVSAAYLTKHVKGEYIFISKPLEKTPQLHFVEGLVIECTFPDGGDGVFDDSQKDGNEK
jgi:hypothetical protein